MSTPRFAVDRIHRIAVIGAGTMGHGIAHVAALAGHDVRLYDVTAEAAAAGRAKVVANLGKGVELGKLAGELRDAALARLTATGDLAAACAEVAGNAGSVASTASREVQMREGQFMVCAPYFGE